MSGTREPPPTNGRRAASQDTRAVGNHRSNTDFEQCVRKLCLRLGVEYDVHEIVRWARIGVALAEKQPELRPKGRGPGRPKGSRGRVREPENLRKLLDAIEIVMDEHPEPFSVVLPRAIEFATKRGILKADVDRRTHPKRLGRLWQKRQECIIGEISQVRRAGQEIEGRVSSSPVVQTRVLECEP